MHPFRGPIYIYIYLNEHIQIVALAVGFDHVSLAVVSIVAANLLLIKIVAGACWKSLESMVLL